MDRKSREQLAPGTRTMKRAILALSLLTLAAGGLGAGPAFSDDAAFKPAIQYAEVNSPITPAARASRSS
jgi:hypothetical protein